MAQKFQLLEKAAVNPEKKAQIPDVLPAIATRTNMLIYPSLVMPLYVGRDKSLTALEESIAKYDQLIFLISQKDVTTENPTVEDLYKVGTVARIVQLMKMPDGNYKILVEGLARAKIVDVAEKDNLFVFKIEVLKAKYRRTKVLEALIRKVKELAMKYVNMSRRYPDESIVALEDTANPDKFADFVSSLLPLPLRRKAKTPGCCIAQGEIRAASRDFNPGSRNTQS
nr:LON peptidase substrate-binding domain-containing protein [Kosmotoga sp. DU53]